MQSDVAFQDEVGRGGCGNRNIARCAQTFAAIECAAGRGLGGGGLQVQGGQWMARPQDEAKNIHMYVLPLHAYSAYEGEKGEKRGEGSGGALGRGGGTALP